MSGAIPLLPLRGGDRVNVTVYLLGPHIPMTTESTLTLNYD
jgi:hypothetical protein